MQRREACHNDYLESKVLTATGPRLQLMLVEGALRFTLRAQDAIASGDAATTAEALERTINIVAELLAGVRHTDAPINKQLTSVYRYLLRTTAQAYFDSDPQKVADAVRVLEAERVTWQRACEKSAAEPATTPAAAYPLASNSPCTAGISFQA